MTKQIKDKIINGIDITYNEALSLINAPFDELLNCADEIREHFCKNIFDVCSIINAKSGRCSEDCKFCAQSAHYKTDISEYPLLDKDKIVKEALYMAEKGVLRFSIVTSGKALTDKDVDIIAEVIKEIKSKSNISICASLGLLSASNFEKLKNAGLERVHNNLEASKNYFPKVCSTHTFEDKVNALKKAVSSGLSVCSGGIIGLGETMHDRIDLAFSLKELGIKSVPLNILSNIKGTPYENNKRLSESEILRTAAIFRFILPDAFIRLAGGRAQLSDSGKKAFLSGINAVITGDMLTTSGISVDTDMQMIKDTGYIVELIN
ncbi:MAG TPA: biotin synthase BioB [Candidatus Mucispirillum faecigallinarum]|uniref:Biotin synthase n=1 Tax=Candidatus Mucispirillum faecigallinarum TaxID=2838699 RepID=A0A9D2GU89_9BACT|nr:biotin synthase BioB [Candidatus Mucispirillum faecigallinarum]